jgi:hypothetical protein
MPDVTFVVLVDETADTSFRQTSFPEAEMDAVPSAVPVGERNRIRFTGFAPFETTWKRIR